MTFPATCNDFTMKTLQVPFNLRVSGTVSWQKRSRWNCMCHDAGVLAYTLASWQGFRETAPFSVTTHEFNMKVLRRGRSPLLSPSVIARSTLTVIARLHRSRGNLRVWDEIATSDYRPPRNDSGKFRQDARNHLSVSLPNECNSHYRKTGDWSSKHDRSPVF